MARLAFPKKAMAFFASPKYFIQPYLPQDYQKDSQGFSIEGFVHVEAGWKGKGKMAAIEETKWLAKINPVSGPRILAMIVNADLSRGSEVEDLIKAHKGASPLVKGAREALSWQADKGILNGCADPDRIHNPNWRKGFECLLKTGLSFEGTIYHNQLEQLGELAGAYPEQAIMLSHLATPVAGAGAFGGSGKTTQERADIFKSWQSGLSKLAEHANVSVKLSGLAMPVCGFGWEHRAQPPSTQEIADAFAPYFDHAIKAFGADRCLFGSNFPIDKVSLPLKHLIDAYLILFKALSIQDRQKIFYQNALDFYRMEF